MGALREQLGIDGQGKKPSRKGRKRKADNTNEEEDTIKLIEELKNEHPDIPNFGYMPHVMRQQGAEAKRSRGHKTSVGGESAVHEKTGIKGFLENTKVSKLKRKKATSKNIAARNQGCTRDILME